MFLINIVYHITFFFISDSILAPGRCLSAQEPSARYQRSKADVPCEIKIKLPRYDFYIFNLQKICIMQ